MLDPPILILAQGDGAPPPKAPGGPVTAGPGTGAVEGQPGTTADPNANPPPRSADLFGSNMGLFLLLMLAAIIGMTFFSSRKEKKKRRTMLAAMQKGNKVQTVGGVLGTVVEVRDDEVVVKVDENANIRLRFARSAIQAVLDEPKE